jgi:hypothetical protein
MKIKNGTEGTQKLVRFELNSAENSDWHGTIRGKSRRKGDAVDSETGFFTIMDGGPTQHCQQRFSMGISWSTALTPHGKLLNLHILQRPQTPRTQYGAKNLRTFKPANIRVGRLF